jgi:hypothetical protein
MTSSCTMPLTDRVRPGTPLLMYNSSCAPTLLFTIVMYDHRPRPNSLEKENELRVSVGGLRQNTKRVPLRPRGYQRHATYYVLSGGKFFAFQKKGRAERPFLMFRLEGRPLSFVAASMGEQRHRPRTSSQALYLQKGRQGVHFQKGLHT